MLIRTSKGDLTVLNDQQISLNFAIATVQDISTRNGGYSLEILLPSTVQNDQILGNLFDIHQSFDLFDPNKKTDCQLISEGLPLSTGVFQLLDVSINRSERLYSGVFYEKKLDFIQTIADKRLEDLDFSDLDHRYSITNLQNSWSTYKDYYYPALYRAQLDANGEPIKDDNDMILSYDYSQYNVDDFKPAIRVKKYVDEIFRQNGFTYTSTFFNSPRFKSLIIPYNGDVRHLSGAEANTYSVDLKSSLTQSYSATLTNQNNNSALPYDQTFLSTTPVQYRYNTTNTDPSFQYTSSTGILTVANSGTYTIAARFEFINAAIMLNNPGQLTIEPRNFLNFDKVQIVAQLVSNSFVVGESVLKEFAIGDLDGFDSSTVQGNTSYSLGTISGSLIFSNDTVTPGTLKPVGLTANDPLNIRLLVKGEYRFIDFNGNDTTATLTFQQSGNNANNTFTMALIEKPEVLEGNNIVMNNWIPKDVNQLDFLNSLTKMFNLYTEQNPANPTNYTIEPRDKFLESGTVLDWNSKISSDDTRNIAYLGQLQSKEYHFKYADASDFYLDRYKNDEYYIGLYANRVKFDDYNSSKDDGFMSFKYVFDNDFLNDSTDIDLIFEPTAMTSAPDNKNYVVPYIPCKYPNTGVRILIANPKVIYDTTNGDYFKVYSKTSQATFQYSTVPFAGVYDHPVAINFDLSFGRVAVTEFDYTSNSYKLRNYKGYPNNRRTGTAFVNNTLFNLYYDRFFRELKNSKVYTAKFYLTRNDIATLSFRNRISIDGSLYYINAINNYNPLADDLTEVELIKFNFEEDFYSEDPVLIAANRDTTKSFNVLDGGFNSTINLFNTYPYGIEDGTTVTSAGVGNTEPRVIDGGRN